MSVDILMCPSYQEDMSESFTKLLSHILRPFQQRREHRQERCKKCQDPKQTKRDHDWKTW